MSLEYLLWRHFWFRAQVDIAQGPAKACKLWFIYRWVFHEELSSFKNTYYYKLCLWKFFSVQWVFPALIYVCHNMVYKFKTLQNRKRSKTKWQIYIPFEMLYWKLRTLEQYSVPITATPNHTWWKHIRNTFSMATWHCFTISLFYKGCTYTLRIEYIETRNTVSNAHKMIPLAPPCFVLQSPFSALGNPKIIRKKTLK